MNDEYRPYTGGRPARSAKPIPAERGENRSFSGRKTMEKLRPFFVLLLLLTGKCYEAEI